MDGFGICSEEGSIEVKALRPGTQLRVETMNSVYDIQIVHDLEISISGGLLRTGGSRFPVPTPASLIGATYGYHIKYGRIARGMRLAIEIGHDSIETSLITNVSIVENHAMDWNKENSMSG